MNGAPKFVGRLRFQKLRLRQPPSRLPLIHDKTVDEWGTAGSWLFQDRASCQSYASRSLAKRSAGNALLKKYPCASSHFCFLRNASSSAVSTPSAITHNPRLLAILIIALT